MPDLDLRYGANPHQGRARLLQPADIPFRDNIDRAAQLGVSHVAHAGGSVRDESVREAAATSGVTVIETGVRCFLH